MTYQVQNPATGEVVEEFSTATDAEIKDAIAGAQAAYKEWSARPMSERIAIVQRVAELFGERADELSEIIALEMGKLKSQGSGEAEFSGEIFKYYADNGEKFTADQPIETMSGGKAVIERKPIGPLLGIMPWNYPYYQVARFAAPNLVLGNTIILKHAEICPRSAAAIQQIMDDAGVPKGVYTNVYASHDQIADIIADPRIVGVSLTGSERAGAIVGAQAGKNLKKAVLELGGSDPYIVLDSDNVAKAAKTAFFTRMENSGQACNSNKRIIVMDDIFDEFVATLKELAEKMQEGDPIADERWTYGPLSTRKAAESLDEQVQDAVSKGATLHAGGVLGDAPGAYYAPTVLTGITKEMRAYSEELFGPVIVVYRVSSDQEALELANESDFGLGGAVFATDESRARVLAEKLEVGMSNVNTPAGEGADLPFGGVKRSGFGRELGPLGMDEFVNKRLLYIAE